MIDPEDDLERQLLSLPEFHRGFNWGKPRFGHPEGLVGLHVIEVLKNIQAFDFDKEIFRDLRLLAITHDTFKYLEFERMKNGASKLHHGLLARQFLEAYVKDERLLTIIERHDEAYHIWRLHHLRKKTELAAARLEALVADPAIDIALYTLFFRCDTETGDKLQAPWYWFVEELHKRGIRVESDLAR